MGNTDTCTLQHSLSKCKCAEGPFGAHHDICLLPSTSLPTPVNSCTAPWPRRPRRCHRRQHLVSAVKHCCRICCLGGLLSVVATNSDDR